MSKQTTKYEVKVKTGDRKKAGTDADVNIILYDDLGQNSKTVQLDNRFRDDFERGRTDTFTFSDTIDLRYVVKIELWRDKKGLFDEWFVDTIQVRNIRYSDTFIYPVYRWIKAFHHYNIYNFDTFLPQDDPFQEQREMELDDKRVVYVAKQKIPGLVAQVSFLVSIHVHA